MLRSERSTQHLSTASRIVPRHWGTLGVLIRITAESARVEASLYATEVSLSGAGFRGKTSCGINACGTRLAHTARTEVHNITDFEIARSSDIQGFDNFRNSLQGCLKSIEFARSVDPDVADDAISQQ